MREKPDLQNVLNFLHKRVSFIGIGILDNITALTAKLGQDGLTGIIAIGIIVWLYLRR